MSLSFAGLLVCCGIMLMSLRTRAPIVVALIVSFAFGSTAILILPSLGGSSPIVYVVFVFALLGSTALRRDLNRELTTVFSQPVAWVLVVLAIYAGVGAYLLPRIFGGEATAFIPDRFADRFSLGIVELPLAPVSGNITQTLYLFLGILTFIALSVVLLDRRKFLAIKQGYFALAILHIALGLIQLFGRIAGLGDVLAPIRTASYAMVTSAGVAGFWRIVGSYSEASSFGAATVLLLAFTFSYWRWTHDRMALVLSVTLVVLLILSTSTTAYVAGAVLGLFVLASVAGAALKNRMSKQDLMLMLAALVGLVAIVGVIVLNERALDPFWRLFDTMIVNKVSSASGEERAYWNYRSLEAVYETAGLGIGLGSSRASSWIIAVISQLGIAGSFLMGFLVLTIVRSGRLQGAEVTDPETRHIALSVRSSCLAGLLTASISAGSADPGVLFFIAAAVVLSYERLLRQSCARLVLPSRAAPSLAGERA